jgi:hypothetical protein
MDETGLIGGKGINGNYLAWDDSRWKKKRWVVVKGREIRTWISIIEGINAEGNSVIFNGRQGPKNNDTRMLLRKAAKALDVKNVEIAAVQLGKKTLEQELVDLRPKKVRVVTDPNRRFVQNETVPLAQSITYARKM